MGRDKASLPFGPDEVLLERVVRRVAEAVPRERIVVVAAPAQAVPVLPPGVEMVYDATPHGGPLAGLVTGLAALVGEADAAFACGCDVPLLAPALVTRMFDLLGDHRAVVPHDGQQDHPLMAVYRLDVLTVAESLLAVGERSVVALLAACDTRRVPVAELRNVDAELLSLAPCNTPSEYQELLARDYPRAAEP